VKGNVLILCEASGTIRNTFARRGWNAVSVDLRETFGAVGPMSEDDGHASHMVTDALRYTEGGDLHHLVWDLVIAHPTCTYLTNSGVRWLHEKCDDGTLTDRAWRRWGQLIEGIRFFNAMKTANSRHIAVENPVPHKYAREGFDGIAGIGAPTQSVQPYMFGHTETKRTCWWLHNLPPLVATDDVKAETMALPYAERAKVHYASPGPNRGMERSALVQGMADAIADQWGTHVLDQKEN